MVYLILSPQVALATEWLVFNDLVTQYIQHKQDYRVLPYLPFLSVTFHFLFASNVAPKIQYPHSQAEVRYLGSILHKHVAFLELLNSTQ